ncbi:MAG: Na/Pi cotransporter family protein, partial [Clostridia bacterium]|nr:Na/Pi cotransporter family protein [Clostridia bacterium]
MEVWTIIKNILMLLAGLGVFMYGMKHMGDSLQAGSGEKLRYVFSKITGSRMRGIATGAAVTAVIQSSSATTVMVVGFVNAGILTLTQATSVIMGANIGTTVTGLIISLKSLPIAQIFAALSCIGIFIIIFSKNARLRIIANVIIGLGFIFVGLIIMGSAMKDFSALPAVKEMFINTTNPILLLLIGALLTAIIQSSSATTGILITLAGVGLIELDSALYVILGVNIGTCITAMLAAIGTVTAAKRAAVVHLLFNLIGTFVFLMLFIIPSINRAIVFILPGNIEFKIAIFHLLFNISTTLLLAPFIGILVRFVEKIVPGKLIIDTHALTTKYIDDRLLATPSIALGECKEEIIYMAGLAYDNFATSIKAIISFDLSEREAFDKQENLINYLNKEITKYLVKISGSIASTYEEAII